MSLVPSPYFLVPSPSSWFGKSRTSSGKALCSRPRRDRLFEHRERALGETKKQHGPSASQPEFGALGFRFLKTNVRVSKNQVARIWTPNSTALFCKDTQKENPHASGTAVWKLTGVPLKRTVIKGSFSGLFGLRFQAWAPNLGSYCTLFFLVCVCVCVWGDQ